jgi:predicted DNA-binding transcriptional regulator YafY
MLATVEFTGEGGAVGAAARLGRAVAGSNSQRQFDVRRVDAFARWLLSFAGQAMPVSPPEIVTVFQDLARVALEVHNRAPGVVDDSSDHAESRTKPSKVNTVLSDTATAQLQRLLAALPVLASEDAVRLKTVAARTGMPIETIIQDLRALTDRIDAPAGFVEAIQVYLERQQIGIVTSHFLRPTRLNRAELVAIELGLAMLRQEALPEDHAWIDRARVRLHGALAGAEAVALTTNSAQGEIAAEGLGTSTDLDRVNLRILRTAFAERRTARIEYRARGSTSRRIIRVYGVAYASGTWYFVAYSEDRAAVRRFRLDRIERAEILRETYSIPAGFKLEQELDADRVRLQQSARPDMLRLRFSPRIARWISEREGCNMNRDGTVTVEYPLLDVEWAIAYVLHYAADAEVLSPASVREMIVDRLERASPER